MTLDNIEIGKKYFVTADSGEVIRVTARGISAKGNVKCTVDDFGIELSGRFKINPLSLKPDELCEESDFLSVNILLDKAESQIAKLRNEIAKLKNECAFREAKAKRSADEECKKMKKDFEYLIESEMKFFASAMVIPTFNDNWRDKFFEIIQDRGISVSKEYLYEIFNPERYHEYDKSNPMPYDLFGIEGFITDIYQRNYGLLFEDLEDFLRSEYHRLNPELDNKPYSLDDLINNGYIDQMYTTMQEELFDKIDTEDFKNFVLSIAE